MKKTHLLLGAGSVLILLAVFYYQAAKPYLENRTIPTVAEMQIVNRDLNFSFTYPSGEAGYTLIEPPVAPAETGIQKVYLIMDTQEYQTYSNADTTTQAPATVSVFVVKPPERPDGEEQVYRITRLQQWAEANSQISSFAFRTSEPEIVELDGAKALRYETSGTYEQVVYLALYRGNIYIFTGQSNGEDAIASMFDTMVGTILFE